MKNLLGQKNPNKEIAKNSYGPLPVAEAYKKAEL